MPEQRDAQTEQRDALTELVRASVGTGRRMSTREFSAAAVDGEKPGGVRGRAWSRRSSAVRGTP